MDNSVCAVLRSLTSPEEVAKLQSEVKLASSILDAVSQLFWEEPPQSIMDYISKTENKFDKFQILKDKTDEIKKHLQAFKNGQEKIDDTRLWVELFAEDFRKAAKLLDME